MLCSGPGLVLALILAILTFVCWLHSSTPNLHALQVQAQCEREGESVSGELCFDWLGSIMGTSQNRSSQPAGCGALIGQAFGEWRSTQIRMTR